MITNEMVRLLVRWYAVTEESAAEIIAELRDRTSLLHLVSPHMVRARAVEAKAPGPPPNDLLGASQPESPSEPGEGRHGAIPPLVGLGALNPI